MKIQTILSSNIKKLRKQHSYTQEFLAEKADISIAALQTLEYGSSWPEIGTLEKLAKVFKCDTARLFRDERLFSSDGITKAFVELAHDLQKFQNNIGKEVIKISSIKNVNKP